MILSTEKNDIQQQYLGDDAVEGDGLDGGGRVAFLTFHFMIHFGSAFIDQEDATQQQYQVFSGDPHFIIRPCGPGNSEQIIGKSEYEGNHGEQSQPDEHGEYQTDPPRFFLLVLGKSRR